MGAMKRRAFLRASGVATGLAALGTARPAYASAPDTTLAAAAARRSRILGSGVFPIGMWWPPPPEFTTPERYREIARAGFNFVTAGDGVAEMPLNETMLSCADSARLLAIPQDSRVNGFPDDPAEQRSAVLAEYAGHRSFAGFYLDDEPSTQAFPAIADIERAIRQATDRTLSYVNLFPNYATPEQLGAPDYDAYLDQFVAAVNPPFLSFDFYPFMSDGTTFPGYFANWASVRRASLRAGIPSWVFIQSIAYPSRRRPTEAELRWQINVSLAYGCTGIQYFCYWSPGGTFGPGLISRDGERTPLYDAARRINTGYLCPVGGEVLPLDSESVAHANESPLPAGAIAFSGDRYVADVTGSAVIVSRFLDPRGHRPSRWLLVANRSFDTAAAATLAFGAAVDTVLEFEPDGRRYRPLPGAADGGLTVELGAGAARLYLLATDRRPAAP